MFTFAYVCVEYETSISIWHIWNIERIKMIVSPLIQFAILLNSQNINEIEIHN